MKTEGVINYTGNKSKLIEPLNELFKHSKADRLVDCCAGGLSVTLHSNFKNVLANDISPVLTSMYSHMRELGPDRTVRVIKNLIERNGLGKDKLQSMVYNEFREVTNNLIARTGIRDTIVLHRLMVLQYHSFSNIIRFNSDGKFNAPFGQRTFNKSSERKLKDFFDIIYTKDVEFSRKSFDQLDISDTDLVYIDPPYLITEAVYNAGWNQDSDIKMMNWLDELDSRGVEFVMSNVTHHRGKVNEKLIEWMSKYQVHSQDHRYVFNAYQAKDMGEDTVEVMITNIKKD